MRAGAPASCPRDGSAAAVDKLVTISLEDLRCFGIKRLEAAGLLRTSFD